MASQPPGSPLSPTFQGFISSTMDALVLFEACLTGRLTHVARRPHDRERAQLIKSGNVFIYEEHSSGIKRWTDGVPWSPSRILGNFLLYRELDKPFQPGEKKRAMKRGKTDGVSKPVATSRANSMSSFRPDPMNSSTTMNGMNNATNGSEADRAYVGSLVDSYQFKESGLIKKTISIEYKGIHHHLVSYYNLEDINNGTLKSITDSPELNGVSPRHALVSSGKFRAPIDDNDFGVLDPRFLPPNMVDYAAVNSVPPRSMSIPTTSPYGHQAWNSGYAHSSTYGIQQTLPPPTSHYGQSAMPSFAYEAAYGTSRPSTYSPMMQTTRRHSAVPSTAQLGYPTSTGALLAHGNGLTAHSMPNTYINGDVFGASAAGAVAESAAAGPAVGYSTSGTISHSNGTHGMGGSVPHSTAAFDGQISSGYDNSVGRLTMNDFGAPLQDPEGTNFDPTSTTTTPTNMSLGLDHSEMSSADQQWNRIAKHDNEW
ncbi:Gti1/Pac2 family-domain-containing protein [Nemania abortiva]|nr:Gti1/Pac2 family-domain-containing protein [Nemania abortiva]